MVAVTETSASAQALGGKTPARLPQPVPQPSAQVSTVSEPVAPVGPDRAKAEPPPAPSPIGFTLHFDGDSQRLILEAREPVSGYVIVQIPPKYVVKQFSATIRTNLAPRGQGVDAAV